MVFEYELQTPRGGFLDITAQVSAAVAKFCEETGRTEASCLVFCPHTTAAVTVNENADPDVRGDMEKILNHLVRENEPYYDHVLEGPDDMPAHAKCSLFGVSLTIPVTDGRLNLGTWQGIYLCEFRHDGGERKIVATLYT